MSKGEQKEIRLEIRLPKGGYPKTMFFNRFRVERDHDFCLVHFGLVTSSGVIADRYSCLFPRQTLEHNQKSLLDYLGRVGQPKQKAPPAWQVPASQNVDMVDIVFMAIRENLAETSLFAFSLIAASSGTATAEPLDAQPLVLLRSAPETQKQLLVALYEE